jgi:iron complex outermembrane receptor protein
LTQPAYTLVNAQVGWSFPGDRWRIALSGENLTDKAVEQNVVTSTLGDYTFYGRPRSYSLSVTANF